MDLNPKGGGVKPGVIHGFRLTGFIEANQIFIKGPRSLRDDFHCIGFIGEKDEYCVGSEVMNLEILYKAPHAFQGA